MLKQATELDGDKCGEQPNVLKWISGRASTGEVSAGMLDHDGTGDSSSAAVRHAHRFSAGVARRQPSLKCTRNRWSSWGRRSEPGSISPGDCDQQAAG